MNSVPAVILILTLWAGYKRFRHSTTPLLVILYRDGVLFFSLLLGKPGSDFRP